METLLSEPEYCVSIRIPYPYLHHLTLIRKTMGRTETVNSFSAYAGNRQLEWTYKRESAAIHAFEKLKSTSFARKKGMKNELL